MFGSWKVSKKEKKMLKKIIFSCFALLLEIRKKINQM